MYVERVPNRNSRPTYLLRVGKRHGKKVLKRTLANLTDWPMAKIKALKKVLDNKTLVEPDDVFAILRSRAHGHVAAILAMVKKLKLDRLIDAKPSRQRDLIIAMIVARLIEAAPKLATTRHWHTTTLPDELDVADADADDLYEAMDWLLERQPRIEKKLAKRHLGPGQPVLYDVSSSYYEGKHCPLAQFGHSRDGKKGKPIVVYGIMTDQDGRPVAVQVYPGNTADPTTVPDQVDKLRKGFGLERVILVGDRGLLTQTQIKTLKTYPGLGWISALRAPAIRDLVDGGALQLSLFDQQNLAEISDPAFPDERLVACYNPLLAQDRARKREDLITATETRLDKIVKEVARRTKTPLTKSQIGLKVGRVIERYKVAKHFDLVIEDNHFSYTRNLAAIKREAELDGIYVIRTGEAKKLLSAEQTVRGYKSLSRVEQAFRCFKTIHLNVRPIHHHLSDRVKSHIFLCLLAYYVEWHLRSALAPLLFQDEELDQLRQTRDPVEPAKPSASAQRKKARRKTRDGLTVHSLPTLIAHLGAQGRHQCCVKNDPDGPTFVQITEPDDLQKRAFDLIDAFPV